MGPPQVGLGVVGFGGVRVRSGTGRAGQNFSEYSHTFGAAEGWASLERWAGRPGGQGQIREAGGVGVPGSQLLSPRTH